MLCFLSSSISAWVTQVLLFSLGCFSPKIYQTLERLCDLTPELLSPPGTDRSRQEKGDMGTSSSCCHILLQGKRKGSLTDKICIKSSLVGEHSKCGKINTNKSSQHLATAGQALLQSCRSPSPAGLSCLHTGHLTLWCGTKSCACLGLQVANPAWSWLKANVGLGWSQTSAWWQFRRCSCWFWADKNCTIPCASLLFWSLVSWASGSQSEKKNSTMFWRALKEFYFLHCLQATAVLICLSIHFLFAGTFTLYLAHFKRTTRLYRQKITQ